MNLPSAVIAVVVHIAAFVSFCSAGQHTLFANPSPSNANYSKNASSSGNVSVPKLVPSKSVKMSSEKKNAFMTKLSTIDAVHSTKMYAFPQQTTTLAQQQDGFMPFALYWQSVLDHFGGNVPYKTIANILCRLIAAFKKKIGSNNDFDVITSKADFDTILMPENFLAIKKPKGPALNDGQLLEHIEFVVQKIGVPKNLQLAYMSPEQVIRKMNFSTEADIVWSLGVMLFTMLTNRHPFQAAAAATHLKMAQPNVGKQNANTMAADIDTLLADSSTDMEPKWREMVAGIVKAEEELPIHLQKAPGGGVEHDKWSPLLKACLQIRSADRISLCRMRKMLEEIVEEENEPATE